MKIIKRVTPYVSLIIFGIIFCSYNDSKEVIFKVFPYKSAGLTERQAAAHLLSRFTYGAKPGDVDKVLSIGIENWFYNQLEANSMDDNLNSRLKIYDALQLTNAQVVQQFPRPAQILKMAENDGVIKADSLDKSDKEAYKNMLASYMMKNGLRPLRELHRQFINQKILRASYTDNQLKEVMTDFWFNHFNVSITKNDCAQFVPAYERDVIRTNALGNFEELLIATAKSPAMLFYLDNFSSSGINSDFPAFGNQKFLERLERRKAMGDSSSMLQLSKIQDRKKNAGLNENYAREVMELHTLGVEGGYTQQDVTNAAKILTGWTVYPFQDNGPFKQIKKILEKVGEEKLEQNGFVHQGDFLFAANRHDNSEKTVLGKVFNFKNGYDEGVALLKMLAHHKSTARFICRKLAVRFVSDNPPQSLVNRMAETFLKQNGDIKSILVTMVSSPEFWSKDALRQKIKSPFELAISTIRGLNADIQKPFAVYQAVSKMGQKLYSYQAPTGFPDAGQYWINTGALLNRMNFGLNVTKPYNSYIHINLLGLNNEHEPESALNALEIYSKILLPERNLQETIDRLKPMLNDPDLESKVIKANEKNETAVNKTSEIENDEIDFDSSAGIVDKNSISLSVVKQHQNNKNMLAQVVGIIIGSPEFQRR